MNIRWYHFWHPRSGLIGGIIFGYLLGHIIVFVVLLLK